MKNVGTDSNLEGDLRGRSGRVVSESEDKEMSMCQRGYQFGNRNTNLLGFLRLVHNASQGIHLKQTEAGTLFSLPLFLLWLSYSAH